MAGVFWFVLVSLMSEIVGAVLSLSSMVSVCVLGAPTLAPLVGDERSIKCAVSIEPRNAITRLPADLGEVSPKEHLTIALHS